MPRILPFILFGILFGVCFTSTSLSQVSFPACTGNYYLKTFQHISGNGMDDIIELPGGNLIVCGIIGGQFSISKHSPGGDIIFTRRIKPMSDMKSMVRLDVDGTLFIAAESGKEFYKIDTTGNIIYAKQILNSLSNYVVFKDFTIMPNGDEIMLIEGYSGTMMVVRFSPNLNTIKWCKYLKSTEYGGALQLSSLLADGSKLIVTGTVSPYFYQTYAGAIWQLNTETGLLQKEKYFVVTQPAAPDKTGISLSKIMKYQDGYVIKAYLQAGTILSANDKNSYVKVDTILNVVSVKGLKGVNNNLMQYANEIDLFTEDDGTVYGIHGDRTHNMFIIDKNDSLKSSKRLSSWLGYPKVLIETSDGFISLGYDNYYYVATSTYEGYYYLLKSTKAGDLPGCSLQFDMAIFNVPFQSSTFKMAIADTSDLVVSDISFSTSNFTLNKSTQCNTISSCNSIQIIGPSNYCGTPPVTFKGRRNSNCQLPVSFSVSPSTAISIQALTDSTSAITFPVNGTYMVRSIIQTPCGSHYDSMIVNVHRAALLQLGPDTLVCKNASIKLKAQQGYKAYFWNDGSTDSSLIVNQTGSYNLQVEDYCGQFFYDTIHVNPAPDYPFSVGPDQSICNGEKLALTAPAGFMNYRWYPDYKINSTNTAEITVSPNIDTTYIVSAEKWHGCVVSDTVSITVKPIALIDVGGDTSFCAGDSIILSGENGFSEYSWNTGSTSPAITIKSAGTYSVTGKASNGCYSKDTMIVQQVYALPKVNLGADLNLCIGDLKRLDAGNFKSYIWQNGSNSQYLTVNNKGSYWVNVTDNNNCSSTDTVEVKAILPLPSNFLNDVDSICQYEKLQLQTHRSYIRYNWSTGSTQPNITIERAGVYTLTAMDANGCSGNDTIRVVQKDCMNGVYIPSAFTPNKDGVNDAFSAKVFGKVISFQLQVYNRFGQLVFSTSDPYKVWDGTVNGIPANSAAFAFQCTYLIEGGRPSAIKGTVVLIR